MIIKKADIQWKDDYPVLASKKYMDTVTLENGWLGAYREGELLCFISYGVKTHLFFRYLYFLSDIIPVTPECTHQDIKNFANELIGAASELRADFIEPQFPIGFSSYKPAASTASRFGTYEIDLRQEEETLWENLHSKHRNVIRNALKKEIVITEEKPEEVLDIIHSLMDATMARSSMGFMSKNQLKEFIDSLEGHLTVFIAWYKEEPVCCAIMPWSLDRAYYLYGGSVDRIPVTGAMNLMHWEAMKSFKNRGVRWYDFVGGRVEPEKGSKLEGIQRFKKRFGCEFREGYMWKYSLKPMKYRFFRSLKTIKERKAFEDIVDQERKKGYGAE